MQSRQDAANSKQQAVALVFIPGFLSPLALCPDASFYSYVMPIRVFIDALY